MASRYPRCAFSSLSRARLVQDEVELHPIGRRMTRALGFFPTRAVVLRKPGVALVVAMDLGQDEAGGERQRVGEQLVAADHEYHAFARAEGERCLQRARHGGAWRVV